MKDVLAFAILDKKGRIILDDDGGTLILKTKKRAMETFIPEDEETVQKVRITEA